jgi:hypothetical protein
MSDEIRDVFISYAHADADWVRTLAENLDNSGLQVFYDEWDIVAGDVLIHKLDEGILKSRNGVLIVSPTSLSRPYVQEEYAAMMTRAIAGKQRLIPVLLKDAEIHPCWQIACGWIFATLTDRITWRACATWSAP